MDFRTPRILCTWTAILLLTLSACAKQKTSSSVFEKAGEECAADVIPNQYMVRYVDGSNSIEHANSDQEFMDGFITQNLARIEFAEPDYRIHSKSATLQGAGGPIDNWGVERIGAHQLWAQNIRGAGVNVAVVDTGMDIRHPQLSNRVMVNTNEVAGNGIDDDHNGLIDDYYGFDYANNKGLTADNQYHGTHVAGIIAAYHTDAAAGAHNYVQGTAPESKILPLAFLDKNGEGSMSTGVTAIKYAVSRGVRVINASWGGSGCSRTLRDTIEALDAKNVLFVAAAGNDSLNIDRSKEYPASFELAAQITVGATGNHDIMADYSNYGAHSVHIFAPGTAIISTIPGAQAASLSGTSMATPFVTAAAALLLSAEPTATNAQLRKAFYAAAFKQSSYLNASLGRLDLRQALVELRRQMGK